MSQEWKKSDWRVLPRIQMPNYANNDELIRVEKKLSLEGAELLIQCLSSIENENSKFINK